MSLRRWIIAGLIAAAGVLAAVLMLTANGVTERGIMTPRPADRQGPTIELAVERTIGSNSKASADATGSKQSDPEDGAEIPAPFVGEWNADVRDCATFNNDSRLTVEPRLVRFHESDATVKRVIVHSSKEITVEASLTGEGETWSDQFRLSLSRSGNELAVSGSTRHRCP